ncbi:diguanylate cyclase [Anaerocolumna sp. AGMB13025]|uniref:sensor domain-containing diguanylate cyclase n=1 Tax=Anaerocolumna sp. AGMB13025 TaxID=3039116 RepID=UPI00241E3B2D|nr:diguanylate cyclase [Anaerocolumna sp. AGMB13025]WFR59021.1 diguanylate cyclase [Anaerocolumna sp. AGMB13025]
MGWMREGLKLLISHSGADQEEFENYNSMLVLSRIRLISLADIFLSVFWACMDLLIVYNGADEVYSITLILLHSISIAVSVAFLFFYRRVMGKKEHTDYRLISKVSKIYVFLYIFFGAFSSINSQRYTGNIYTYIILSLIAAVLFNLKPLFMLFAFGVNHLFFLIGINILCHDVTLLLGKVINATILSGAAALLGFIFYRHRMTEFMYRKKLKENEENFKKLFYVNPYPVFITRLKDGKIIEANKRACSLMGINAENLDRFNGIIRYVDHNSRQVLQEELEEHNSTFNRIVEYDFNGKRMWVTANYELIDYHDEKCILTGIMDITNIRRAEEELSHYASIDSLTGILNRRTGFLYLEELIEKAKEEFQEFVLCFLDINNLKYVNDTFGHNEGDRYILTLCNIIKEKLGEEDIFFRMGGDEFIIIFKGRKEAQAEMIWDRIKKEFDERNKQVEFTYNIMASHGLFYYCSGMDTNLEQMIDKADKFMYEEKQQFKKE